MVRLRDPFQNIFCILIKKSVFTAKKLLKFGILALVFCGEISYIENIFFTKLAVSDSY